jgi:hypothetical protein
MIYYAPVTDYVRKSTVTAQDVLNFAPEGGSVAYSGGFKIDGLSNKVYTWGRVRPSPWILDSMHIGCILDTSPSNYQIAISAGPSGGYIGAKFVSVNPWSITAPSGIDTLFDIDILPLLPTIAAEDFVSVTIYYKDTAPASDGFFRDLKLNYIQ